jgi:hypothetical protein
MSKKEKRYVVSSEVAGLLVSQKVQVLSSLKTQTALNSSLELPVLRSKRRRVLRIPVE